LRGGVYQTISFGWRKRKSEEKKGKNVKQEGKKREEKVKLKTRG
jgi:hypothetical protein